MPILTALKGFLSGGDILKTVGGIVDNLTMSKEEKAQLNIDLTKALNEHTEKMAEIAQKETDAYLAEMNSARNLQIEALKQGDVFSKRFIYYLASGVIFLVFVFDGGMLFVKYPTENRDMINMIAGILNSTALVMILSFFFGSSKGSKDAGERMDSMMKQVVASPNKNTLPSNS